jgi:hypothetical protein
MSMATVSVYTRITDANRKRQCELADPKKSYPAGTIFCLRYEVNGRRKLETLKGKGVTYRYALAIAKVRESELLTGAINAAKNAPVVPVPAQPEKPARLTVDQAIDRYLRNASTKSPRTFHGYTYTMKQFRGSCQKQFLDEINKQDLYDFVTYLRIQELSDRIIHNRIEEVVGLLRHYDILNVTIRVKYTEKKISAYTREELRRLFTVCGAEDPVGRSVMVVPTARVVELWDIRHRLTSSDSQAVQDQPFSILYFEGARKKQLQRPSATRNNADDPIPPLAASLEHQNTSPRQRNKALQAIPSIRTALTKGLIRWGQNIRSSLPEAHRS